MLSDVVFDELIGPKTRTAALAIHERVGKSADVSACDPSLGVHQNRRVHSDIVGRLLDKFSPPGALDVILKLYAERAVVPAVGETAIDLAAGGRQSRALCRAKRFDPSYTREGFSDCAAMLQYAPYSSVNAYYRRNTGVLSRRDGDKHARVFGRCPYVKSRNMRQMVERVK